MIPSKDIGQVLRILGQNPTEDQVVEMVMKVSSITMITQLIISYPPPTHNNLIKVTSRKGIYGAS